MIENDEPTMARPPAPVIQQPETEPASTIQVPTEQPVQDMEAAPIEVTPLTEPETANTQQVPTNQAEATSIAPEPTAAPQASPETMTIPPSLPYMGVDDLLTLKIASDPQISPDGALIAYTLQHSDSKKNTTGSAIWLVSSSGGRAAAPWQLTSGEHHDYAPRWSPDGHTLAFLSDRTGSPQIYLLSLKGGEARQLSTLAQGVNEYNWRPDGQALLVHSAWKPADDRGTATDNDTAVIYTRLGAEWDGMGYKQGRYQQLWLIPLEDDAVRITSEPVDLVQSCWSPDGTEIVFCANRRSDPDLTVSMALWVLTVATGQMRRLTPEEGLAQMPAWSPDGQSIAYLYTPDQTEAGNIVPWIVAARGDTAPQLAIQGAEALTCQAWVIDELRSEWLARPEWYPDSKALLVPAQEQGQVHLYRLDLAQNAIVRLTGSNGRYVSPQLSKSGQTITAVRADWFTPGDIWSMDSNGKNQRKLTRINDAFLHTRQLVRPKRITWTSFDNLVIEGWLYLPPLAENAQAPLILAPHGGPTLAWGDSYAHGFQVLAGKGYAVLAPNPRGSTGYSEEFARKIINDWGGDDFRDLMAGIDHVLATEPVDANRLGIGGLSYGGYMTNWAITQTDRFKAAVSRNGISSIASAALLSDQTIWFNLSMEHEALQRERSALTFADRIKTPLLLLHAENDLRCPLSEAMQLFVALRKRKHTVELVRYPNVGHLMSWPDVGTPRQRVDILRREVEWYEHFV